MSWVVEEPLYIVILGVITLAFVGFAWMQTGYRSLLHAAIGVAALTVGLLLLEHLVETEPEAIERTVRQIGREAEANRRDVVYSYVYSGAPETLAEAKREFPRWEFSRVSIKRNFETVVNMNDNPPSAEVSFNVVVDVKQVNGYYDGPAASFVRLTMRKEGDQWKVAEYSHEEFSAGMRTGPPRKGPANQ
jgi:hypothetical protein